MADTPTTKYLRRVAELNPMWRSADLVDLRSRAFQITRQDKAKTTEAYSGDIQQLRTAYRDFLHRIQAQFWQMPQPMLLQQLDSIDTQHLPELVPIIQRLRTVAAARGEFPKLAQEKWMIAPLFQAFKTAVVLPQSDAGLVRERFTGSIPNKKELAAIRKAADLIQQHYPHLYALESDFFETLRKVTLRKPKSDMFAAADHSSDSEGWGGLGWFGIVILFVLIRGLLAFLSRS